MYWFIKNKMNVYITDILISQVYSLNDLFFKKNGHVKIRYMDNEC